MATKIVAVVYDDGGTVTASPHSKATLFEVAEGPGKGTRGSDADLHDQIGPVVWDHSRVSLYKTGEIVPWEQWRAMAAEAWAGVHAKCEAAATAIAALPVDKRGGWAVYLLEQLEATVGAEGQATLEQVSDAITTRLQHGLW